MRLCNENMYGQLLKRYIRSDNKYTRVYNVVTRATLEDFVLLYERKLYVKTVRFQHFSYLSIAIIYDDF